MNFLTGELFLPSRTANQYLARYWFAVHSHGSGNSPGFTMIHPFPTLGFDPRGTRFMMNFLTGELFLPSRTANQYLARYWFAVRDGKNSSPVKKFISSKRIDFRAILRNTLGTPLASLLSSLLSWLLVTGFIRTSSPKIRIRMNVKIVQKLNSRLQARIRFGTTLQCAGK